tara:strand:- start:1 stop:636 length:636 start_codon:yes stop_codon:yes gene_type:complete
MMNQNMLVMLFAVFLMQQNNQQMTQMLPMLMMAMFMLSMNRPKVERFEIPTVDNVKETASEITGNITNGAKNLVNKALGKEAPPAAPPAEQPQQGAPAQQQNSQYDGVDKEAALGGAPKQEENAQVDNQGQPEKRMATEIPPTKVLDSGSKEWNGYSVVDPAQWALPQKRPPICVTEKQCPVCPLVAETYPNVMVRQKILPFDSYDEKNWK